MCLFEACWDRKNGTIIQNHDITSNIKPEIGKIRPIVVIYPHKRVKLAIVIPFTTKKPFKKNTYAIHIPAGIMPGVLGACRTFKFFAVNVCKKLKFRAPLGVCKVKNAQKHRFFAFFLSKKAKPDKLLADRNPGAARTGGGAYTVCYMP